MAKEIELTKGKVAIVDDEDYERLSLYKWHITGGFYGKYYTVRKSRCTGKRRDTIPMHREILGLSPDDPLQVDHINQDGLDNRKANLRLATAQQNRRNRPKTKVNPGYKGVKLNKTSSKPRWYAMINLGRGEYKYLGSYDTPEEAARAYDNAARVHFGEFAYPNFSE